MTLTLPVRRSAGAHRGIATLAALLLGSLPLAAEDHQDCPHVRASAPRVQEAVSTGLGRSRTFRGLVEGIDASDGLVMVEEGACRFGVRACLLPDVVIAGPHRLLQVRVVPQKAPGCQLIEAIGHELYHAVEVLREPAVRSFQQLYSLFQRLGATNSGRFETSEAVSAGLAVSREAC